MKKYLPVRKSSGYTIIEIIISLFILILIFSVVQANYRQYIQRSNLDKVRNQMLSDMKLAREYALSGKKPDVCINFAGYIFQTYSATNIYTLSAGCDIPVVVKSVNLADISEGINITADRSVLFKLMGLGTDIAPGPGVNFTISQTTSSVTRTVTVTSGGEIR